MSLLLGAVGLGVWAGKVLFTPPSALSDAPSFVDYEVGIGTVGRSLQFVAVASWLPKDDIRYPGAGIVTSLAVEAGDVLLDGSEVFSVNLRPVVVTVGDVPSFRSLRLRDRGADVSQLQAFLARTGLFDGKIDGVFDRHLRDAVKKWQRSLEVDDDGVVRLGDLMFVPFLPVRVELADTLGLGVPVGNSEVVLRTISEVPSFVIPLLAEQRTLVPLSATVRIEAGDVSWEGQIVEAREDGEGRQLRLVVAAADGGPVCGGDCVDAIPVGDALDFPVEIIVVPETSGPLVPVAAIFTEEGGSTVVMTPDGDRISVEVEAVANGQAIVRGLDLGTIVVLSMVQR